MKLRKLLNEIKLAEIPKTWMKTNGHDSWISLFNIASEYGIDISGNGFPDEIVDFIKTLNFKSYSSDFKKYARLISIPIKNLTLTQGSIDIDRLDRLSDIKRNIPIAIAKFKNKYYVLDGHHRIVIELLNSNMKISALEVIVK